MALILWLALALAAPDAPVFRWTDATHAVVEWRGPGQLVKCRPGAGCYNIPGEWTEADTAMSTDVPGAPPVDYFWRPLALDSYYVEYRGEVSARTPVSWTVTMPLVTN